MKPSAVVTAIFLAIVSIIHWVRAILQWKVMVNTVEIPVWASFAAFIVTAVLALWLWQENKK
jgi:hypothetical protein